MNGSIAFLTWSLTCKCRGHTAASCCPGRIPEGQGVFSVTQRIEGGSHWRGLRTEEWGTVIRKAPYTLCQGPRRISHCWEKILLFFFFLLVQSIKRKFRKRKEQICNYMTIENSLCNLYQLELVFKRILIHSKISRLAFPYLLEVSKFIWQLLPFCWKYS